MSLAKSYCNEIAKELRYNPVYLPGTPVTPGEIIEFKSKQPFGPFISLNSLDNLGIPYAVREDPDPDPIKYSSKRSVSSTFDASATFSDGVKGKLTISFSEEGATYLCAINLKSIKLQNIDSLVDSLARLGKDESYWSRVFIVTGVWIAGKAIVMQSNSKSAQLDIFGSAEGLDPAISGVGSAEIKVATSMAKDAAFFKDWSDIGCLTIFLLTRR